VQHYADWSVTARLSYVEAQQRIAFITRQHQEQYAGLLRELRDAHVRAVQAEGYSKTRAEAGGPWPSASPFSARQNALRAFDFAAQ
jgi:hypothetical protein